ncbi:MAG: hypothetical protein A2919_01325 [Candidatus Spechtbacteria bacterium RIFCSPLOWO2_01_FULL_43_12]|uniref:CHASE domain-containing protein n=1 Tax=Candidatus Spechtbacteria bacterium RIFCSPLOWO2_01_FULL_43_12 TaxID=1802162 RepID=A0A1G2HEA6_9BACT|nr:MAG: hypothetical protein A2919_01325 [Candidatus Spechtbacteria bacterium RIFCSPLOWO2_01_FULL_43_12]
MVQIRTRILQKILSYIAVAVFSVLMAITFFVWFFAGNSIKDERTARFTQEVREAERFINEKMNNEAASVRAASAFFHGSEEVLRNEWADYVQATSFISRNPDVLGFFYAENVKAEDLDEFTASVRSDTSVSPDGYPNFNVFAVGGEEPDFFIFTVTGEEKDEYSPLLYIEPLESREAALGLDITSYEPWNETARQAVAFRAPVLSPVFVREGEGFGAIILSPVYTNRGAGPLMGFVGLGTDLGTVFDEIFETEYQFGIDFEIFDGGNISEESLIYNRDDVLHATTWEEHKRLATTRILDVAEHKWTLYASADPGYGTDAAESYLPQFILVLGVLLSISISGVIYIFSTSHSRALELAAEMSATYREERNRLQAVLSSMNEGVLVMDRAGKLVLMNNYASRKLEIGWEYIGKKATDILEMYKGRKKISAEDWPVADTLKTGETIVTTSKDRYYYKTITGKKFPVILVMASMKGVEQKGAVIVFRDISE